MSGQRSILDIIDEHLHGDALQLPSYSPLAARIQAVAQDPDGDVRQIEQVILQDPALAGNVLRVANSALYAGLAKVNTIGQAVARLGMNEIVSLVVLCTQAGEYRAHNATIDQCMMMCWRHAMGCALGAKWLAERCGQRQRAPEAFLAGLFHDIGKLLLLKVFDEIERNSETQGRFSSVLMREVLVTRHAEQGARLLTHWNLDESYIDIARSHHEPELDAGKPLAACVRLANLACRKVGVSLHAEEQTPLAASAEALLLGVDESALAELVSTLREAMQHLTKAA